MVHEHGDSPYGDELRMLAAALRRSGHSLLVELEALRLATQGKALLWRALLAASPQDARLDWGPLEQLLHRARQQSETLDSLHDRAAAGLLSPAPSRGATAVTATGKETPS
ncbi:hypothetical protein [Streptomyces sp. SA15]|uniref:hypothetical protein n=1 Tax=Streptomyces sp. SA15 TaxID=934019 RepID=UPI0026D1B16F|nr:hypothetical protein [Streptomyces sp. SA15]